jgi:hypothetical protein
VEEAELGGRVNATIYYTSDGLAYPSQWIVPNKEHNTLLRGVITRVFYVKNNLGHYVVCPRPTVSNTKGLAAFKSALLRKLKPGPIVPLENIPGMYVGSKRKIYQRAVDSYLTKPFGANDAVIAAHTKVEKVLVSIGPNSSVAEERDLWKKDPRVIQARTPRYNAQLGRYLKSNEHRFFQAIDRVFEDQHGLPTVMKGLNAKQQGEAIAAKWKQFDEPIGIRLDAKRFDQHCSPLVLKFEHSCYVAGLAPVMTGVERKFLQTLLAHQLSNRCFGTTKNGKLKYVAHGRMSGDMNTGLGNVIIMCAMMHSFFGVVREEIAKRWPTDPPAKLALINNGDDCCVLMELKYHGVLLELLEPWFLGYGFEMDVEGTATMLEQVKFCQSHPIWTPSGYVMVRCMPTSLAKDAINLGEVNDQVGYDNWRAAIAGCGLALTRGIPIAQAYYQCLGRGTRFEKPRVYSCGMHFLAHGMEVGVDEIHPNTRVSICNAFGIAPDMQRHLESHYESLDVTKWRSDATNSATGTVGCGNTPWFAD